MTNLKKSYLVSALAILALTFCVMILSQAVMASQKSSRHDEVKMSDGSVPLPAPDAKKPAIQERESTRDVLTLEGEEPPADRSDRSEAVTSVEEGGETIATATVLPGPYLVAAHITGNTTAFAHDHDAICHGGDKDGGRDVVYSFTPAMNGGLALDLCASGYDTKVWVVVSDGLGGYTEVACDDDGCGSTYRSILAAFPITSGTTYYIIVGGYSAADFGAYDMLITQYGDPGTACANPLPITFAPALNGAVYPVDLSLSPMGNCKVTANPTGRSFYYLFTSPKSGVYTFTWCDDGTVPLVPVLPTYPLGRWSCIDYPSCAGGAYLIAPYVGGIIPSPSTCAINGPKTLQFVIMPGATQLIEICNRQGEMFKGTLTVAWTQLVAYNDDCANAQVISAGNHYPGVFVHNVDATLDGPAASFCDPTGETCADVWYTWQATQTGYVNFDMCDYGVSGGNGWDSKMMVYRGVACLGPDPGRLPDPFGCSDDGCGLFGDGGWIEVPCTAGEFFLIRVAGWYNSTNACGAGGMGTGELVIWQDVVSYKPVNDDCDDAVPSTLVAGVTTSETGNMHYSSWDDCPSAYTDGYMNLGWSTFHAFELTTCANVQIDFCGTPDQTLGFVRSAFTAWGTFTGIVVYTGCVCSGDFVMAPASSGAWGGGALGVCGAYYPNSDFNRVWQFQSLIPGTYWFEAGTWTSGARDAGGYYWTGDYQINFKATELVCAYCAASNNPAYCPPSSGATWMSDVAFADVVKNADDGPPAGSPTPNDCNSYEDNMDMVAHVYRGLTYNLDVRMRKLSTPRHLMTGADSCTAFIDWNQNSGLAANQLELGERYTLPGTLSAVYFDRRVEVKIPMDAAGPGEGAMGYTLLRVRVSDATAGTAAACGIMPNGEVEDFIVEVSDLECGDFALPVGVGIEDIAFLRAWYFGYGSAPDIWQRGDIDGDCVITIADIIHLADNLYRGGSLNCNPECVL